MTRLRTTSPAPDPTYIEALFCIREAMPVINLPQNGTRNLWEMKIPTHLGISLILQSKCFNCSCVNILTGPFAERLELLAVKIGADSFTHFDGVLAMFSSGPLRVGNSHRRPGFQHLENEYHQYEYIPGYMADPPTARCVQALECIQRAWGSIYLSKDPGSGRMISKLRCTCSNGEVWLFIKATRPGVVYADLDGPGLFPGALKEAAKQGMDGSVDICGLSAYFDEVPPDYETRFYPEEQSPAPSFSSFSSWSQVTDSDLSLPSPAMDYRQDHGYY
ncbi:hypothetical protein PFICI_09919 [Pestalotiopsis fici W106-1]|uniref:Uncharacterized protein n=1 Tax=Pestalotiopsis fici (strain W106-1 / CGMCC3.15140) TaxID=1229662 RepID=W3WXK8_PESFW|nr:uncharacterized protein PFICI_09919 [Pestalotiopsis fici W106-1]ETS77857.1 hypothetical protein PFICI_09919 [Pestalotiopsis fici W106-1]